MPQDDFDDDGKPSMPPPSLPPPQLKKAPEGGAAMGGAASNTLNLGMAQIIVTAATPMVEDGADKSFPPVGESEEAQPATAEAAAEKKPKQEQKQQPPAKQPEKQKPEPADKKPDIVPKPTAKVLQQKQRTTQPAIAVKEGNEAVVVVAGRSSLTKSSVCRQAEDAHSSLDSASDDVPALQETEDPFNEKSSGGTGAAADGGGFEANFEANFDANFDDAFASAGAGGGGGGGGGGEQSHNLDMNCEAPAEDVIEAPKQVVGGRASIPEELDSNQLARLENLKESNA